MKPLLFRQFDLFLHMHGSDTWGHCVVSSMHQGCRWRHCRSFEWNHFCCNGTALFRDDTAPVGDWHGGMQQQFAHCSSALQMPLYRSAYTIIKNLGLRFRSTPPQFVVNVMKIAAQSVLACTSLGTKVFIRHNTCRIDSAKGISRFGLVLCALWGRLWI